MFTRNAYFEVKRGEFTRMKKMQKVQSCSLVEIYLCIYNTQCALHTYYITLHYDIHPLHEETKFWCKFSYMRKFMWINM